MKNMYNKVAQMFVVSVGLLYAGIVVSSTEDMGFYTVYIDNQAKEDVYYAFKATNKSGKLTPISSEKQRGSNSYQELKGNNYSNKQEVSKIDFPALVLTNTKNLYVTLFVSNSKFALENFLAGKADATQNKLVVSKVIPLPKKKCKAYMGTLTFTIKRSSKAKTMVGGKVLSITMKDDRQCQDTTI